MISLLVKELLEIIISQLSKHSFISFDTFYRTLNSKYIHDLNWIIIIYLRFNKKLKFEYNLESVVDKYDYYFYLLTMKRLKFINKINFLEMI